MVEREGGPRMQRVAPLPLSLPSVLGQFPAKLRPAHTALIILQQTRLARSACFTVNRTQEYFPGLAVKAGRVRRVFGRGMSLTQR